MQIQPDMITPDSGRNESSSWFYIVAERREYVLKVYYGIFRQTQSGKTPSFLKENT